MTKVPGAQALAALVVQAALVAHGLMDIVLSSVAAGAAEPRVHQVDPSTEDMAEVRYSVVLAEGLVEWVVG